MIEFALMAALLVPLLLWVFVNGMNLIRMIQCTQICRDIGNQYIHGLGLFLPCPRRRCHLISLPAMASR